MYDKQELKHRKKTKSSGPEGKTRIVFDTIIIIVDMTEKILYLKCLMCNQKDPWGWDVRVHELPGKI